MLVIALVIAFVLFIVFMAILQTLVGLALAVLVALVAGLIAEGVVGGQKRSVIFTITVGFIGALVGAIVAHVAGLPRFIAIGGLPVVWTVVGAVIVVVAWRLIGSEKS